MDALYSKDGIIGAAFAIERLITHCPQPIDAAPGLVDLYTDWKAKEISSLPVIRNQSPFAFLFSPRSPSPSPSFSSSSSLSSASHSPPTPAVDDTLQRLKDLRAEKKSQKEPCLTRGEAQRLVNLRAGNLRAGKKIILSWKEISEKFASLAPHLLCELYEEERNRGVAP